jgi:hypothetical protein
MTGEYASLAVSSSGAVHVSCYDGFSGDQDYATAPGVSGAFSKTGVDTANVTGWHGNMVLDGNGKPHIGYYDMSTGTLRYAEKTSGSWRTLTVPEPSVTQARITIGVDGSGIQRIGYESLGSIKIARYLP